MALTVTSNMTIYSCVGDGECGSSFAGVPTNETEWPIYGAACLGQDVDAETVYITGQTSLGGLDWSNGVFVYAWFLCLTVNTLATKSAGGFRIGLRDSTNYSYWYVGGSDTYNGGWERFGFNTLQSPDYSPGTPADLTNVQVIRIGWTCTAKSRLSDNCFVDLVQYGTAPLLTITGTTATTGNGWIEAAAADFAAGPYGIIRREGNNIILKGPIEIGDSSGTGSVDFSDYNTSVYWDDQQVSDGVYGITIAGNSTGSTNVQIGNVYGSGDNRQGISGNLIKTNGPTWWWDSSTYISYISTIKLYGCTFVNAEDGFKMDGLSTAANSSAISCTWINCYGPETGSSNNGAEILNSNIIDPTGSTDNYGLIFEQTPSGGELIHNTSNINFVTSGSPSTVYMTNFSYSGDYELDWDNFIFNGTYTSSTIQHGINSGTNADIIINALNNTNADETEFTNTASGTVDVTASVPVKVTVKTKNNVAISGAQVSVHLTTGTEIVNTDSDGSGEVQTSFSGTTPASVIIRVRKTSTGTRYTNYSSTGIIQTNTGLDTTAVLYEDLNI